MGLWRSKFPGVSVEVMALRKNDVKERKGEERKEERKGRREASYTKDGGVEKDSGKGERQTG